jgi:hypothetical protein
VDARLSSIVNRVKAQQYQMNPAAGGEIVDGSILLQIELIQQGLGTTFQEGDLFEALDKLGVPQEEQISWFESMASWV